MSVIFDFILSIEVENLRLALVETRFGLMDIVPVLLTLRPDDIHEFVFETVISHVIGDQRFSEKNS